MDRQRIARIALAVVNGESSFLVRTASLVESLDKELLNRTLWYENRNGDVWVPDFEKNGFEEPPEGFIYQHSMFPSTLREGMLKIIQADEVTNCDHPERYIRETFGWIDPIEGRECMQCGGTQQRTRGQEWPETWEAYGSRSIGAMEMGWNEELALGLVSKGFSLSEAIIACATCCERCMNVMAHECGLEWGYALESEEYEKCGTSCKFCKPEGDV
jgi:hypothetical protein